MGTLVSGRDVLTIPDGWSIEPYYIDSRGRSSADLKRYYIIKTPDSGPSQMFVTIDFEQRGFRSGVSIDGPLASGDRKYLGRGWKQSLVTGAVRYLSAIRRS